MRKSETATGIPAWAMRTVLATSVALLAAAVLLALLPNPGFAPNRSWLSPVVMHCTLNAAVYYAVWRLHRRAIFYSDFAAPLTLTTLLAFGMGNIDLVLAGFAVFNFGERTAGLLALAVPGTVGWLIITFADFEKEKRKEVFGEDEDAAIAEPTELPLAVTARIQGIYALFNVLQVPLLIFGFAICAMWFYIVWYSISEGYEYGPWRVVELLGSALQRNFLLAVVMMGVIAVFTAVVAMYAILKAPVVRLWHRLGFGVITEEQRTFVQERMEAVWEFANRPGRKSAAFPYFGLLFVIFGAMAGAAIALMIYNDDLSFWLYRRSHALSGWYIFEASYGGAVVFLMASLLVAWSVWRLVVDLWPGGAEYAATIGLQRGLDAAGSEVPQVRRRLRRLVRKKGEIPFDPREFLLSYRRRISNNIHRSAILAIPVAILAVWASLRTFTLVTPAGIEDTDVFSGTKYYSFADVRRVEIRCTVDARGDTNFGWRAVLADSRKVDLFKKHSVEDNLPALLEIDGALRGAGTFFETRDRKTGKETVEDDCLDDLSQKVSDKGGFRRLMHRE